MGIHREGGRYSASVEGYFVPRGGQRIRLAKTNGDCFVFAESQELSAGTIGDLVVTVDGTTDTKLVELPSGSYLGQSFVAYKVVAPF